MVLAACSAIEKRPLTECERSLRIARRGRLAHNGFGVVGRNNWIWRSPDDVAARWR